ncbi:helix-turn-helix transcriptional regulator [Hyphomonas jannaschiana]|uniref:helix-turn-helix transcriptional regulator n=1 Tax=Hyphomonas jannaschiana TaxID=86 RepID=UPI0035C6A3C7
MSFLSISDVSELLAISESTLARFRQTGDGPAFVKAGRRVLYDKQQVDKWISERTFNSTTEHGEFLNGRYQKCLL